MMVFADSLSRQQRCLDVPLLRKATDMYLDHAEKRDILKQGRRSDGGDMHSLMKIK